MDVEEEEGGFGEQQTLGIAEPLIEELATIGKQSNFVGRFRDSSEATRLVLAQQLLKLDSTTPGGLVDYCSRGRQLLSTYKPGSEQTSKTVYSPPRFGESLKSNTPRFEECEELGLAETPFMAFVLVAGGLGERLGYPGTKVGIEVDSLTNKSFLEHHCDWIAALQDRARIIMNQPDLTLPLAIMTSGDTHDEIVRLLNSEDESGEYMLSGLSDVTVLKQEKVPCFENLQGDLALDETGAKLVCKPHGHGDVHALLHKSGLIQRWTQQRKLKWLFVFQDTNALSFRSCCAGLGSSVRNDFDLNMIAVKRRVGEAVGAIVHDEQNGGRTRNVEYNLIQEEATAAQQDSPLPGNINILIIKLSKYAMTLKKTDGIVPEFVNPKLTAEGAMKTPTRLECMMQDLPLIMDLASKVGYTEMERFLSFSAVKNNLKDALLKFQQTGYPESASSCESDLFSSNRKLLAMSGVQIHTTGAMVRKVRYHNIPFEDGAKIVLNPRFGTTVAEIRSRFPSPESIHISDRSCLVLEGNIIIHSLHLDGYLIVKAIPGARVVIKSLSVKNEGCSFDQIDVLGEECRGFSPSERARGYTAKVDEHLSIVADKAGQQVVIDRPA